MGCPCKVGLMSVQDCVKGCGEHVGMTVIQPSNTHEKKLKRGKMSLPLLNDRLSHNPHAAKYVKKINKIKV